VHSDQTRFPAAMRTNLLFGDVRFDEDVKTAKEIERRQWLEDLQKQIEDNKRHKYTRQETERRQDFLNENVQPILQEAANRHQQQKEIPTTNHSGQDLNRFHHHDSLAQQTFDRRSQMNDKPQGNGHQTDSLGQILPSNLYEFLNIDLICLSRW
jgi:hypothetical protein